MAKDFFLSFFDLEALKKNIQAQSRFSVFGFRYFPLTYMSFSIPPFEQQRYHKAQMQLSTTETGISDENGNSTRKRHIRETVGAWRQNFLACAPCLLCWPITTHSVPFAASLLSPQDFVVFLHGKEKYCA